MPNFTIDQKDDAWELSINKPETDEDYKQKEEDLQDNVIDVITNLIKTYPKDPLITSYSSLLPTTTTPVSQKLTHKLKMYTKTPHVTSYNAPLPSQTTTPPPIKVTASSIRDKNNNYYSIEISQDQKATDLSIFHFLKNIVKNAAVPK